jgi:ferredoxin--NADP+ reductase
MRILEKKILSKISPRIIKLKIYTPLICKKAKPGQFVVLMVKKEGERIPLTIVDTDKKKKSITLIFQEVGLTTKFLGKLKKKDRLVSLLGPLGNPTEIKKYGKVILIGGGIGIAEIFPVAKALKKEGNYLIGILGARKKEFLILEGELKNICDQIYITTDDGSYGKKGVVTDVLKDILKKDRFSLVYAVGPIAMMERVSLITKKFKIKTIVSLNTLMVDATGMCGCCRVYFDKETKFACVDGPEFDAHQLDWKNLKQRNKTYQEKEKDILKFYCL